MQVNEEDHTRLISMEMGADIKSVFERFASAVEKCEKSIQKEGYDWMHNDHLGSPPPLRDALGADFSDRMLSCESAQRASL